MMRKAAHVAGGFALILLLAACASGDRRDVTESSGTSESTGLYFMITNDGKPPKLDRICVHGVDESISMYSSCMKKGYHKLISSTHIFVAVESLRLSQPNLKGECRLRTKTGCHELYNTVVTWEYLSPLYLAFAAVTTVLLDPLVLTEIDAKKVAAFIEREYPAAKRREIVLNERQWRAGAPAREAERRLAAIKQEQERRQNEEIAKQERAREEAYAAAIFRQRVTQPRNVGWVVCDAWRGFGYVERVGDGRILVSVHEVVSPRIKYRYELFSGNIRQIKSVPKETKWVHTSEWAHCDFK